MKFFFVIKKVENRLLTQISITQVGSRSVKKVRIRPEPGSSVLVLTAFVHFSLKAIAFLEFKTVSTWANTMLKRV
jgi:hypothetical protein